MAFGAEQLQIMLLQNLKPQEQSRLFFFRRNVPEFPFFGSQNGTPSFFVVL